MVGRRGSSSSGEALRPPFWYHSYTVQQPVKVWKACVRRAPFAVFGMRLKASGMSVEKPPKCVNDVAVPLGSVAELGDDETRVARPSGPPPWDTGSPCSQAASAMSAVSASAPRAVRVSMVIRLLRLVVVVVAARRRPAAKEAGHEAEAEGDAEVVDRALLFGRRRVHARERGVLEGRVGGRVELVAVPVEEDVVAHVEHDAPAADLVPEPAADLGRRGVDAPVPVVLLGVREYRGAAEAAGHVRLEPADRELE